MSAGSSQCRAEAVCLIFWSHREKTFSLNNDTSWIQSILWPSNHTCMNNGVLHKNVIFCPFLHSSFLGHNRDFSIFWFLSSRVARGWRKISLYNQQTLLPFHTYLVHHTKWSRSRLHRKYSIRTSKSISSAGRINATCIWINICARVRQLCACKQKKQLHFLQHHTADSDLLYSHMGSDGHFTQLKQLIKTFGPAHGPCISFRWRMETVTRATVHV